MQTRSKTRKQKLKSTQSKNQSSDYKTTQDSNRQKRMSNSDFDFIEFEAKEMEKKVYKLDNVDFNNAREQMLTRDQFMHHLFGHRHKFDLFKVESFRNYQKEDNLLSLVYNILKTNTKELPEDDIKFLAKWDPHLTSKLQLGQIRIDDSGILQAVDYSKEHQDNMWMDIVPFAIRGKIMDYFHHNLNCHHYSYDHTLYQIENRYWWGTMKRDVRRFCKRCMLCKFTNGTTQHRSPLSTRYLPAPRQHLFADFLQTGTGYHILALVDYATGYVMLIPTRGTDGATVVNAILQKWVPIFGWFNVFESDWGSGFNSIITKSLMQSQNVQITFAEPKNHRSIGKVERIIGFLQTILRKYNLMFQEGFTNGEPTEVWKSIEIILPFIQMSFNQRRPRFTTFSPNMLMFGQNVKDFSDIERMVRQFDETSKLDLPKTDYEYLYKLRDNLRKLNEDFKSDWKNYVWLSRTTYNEKWKITQKKIKKNKKQFKVKETKVLYYIGDKAEAKQKWRHKWSGPWDISKILSDSTMIICDPESGNQKRVSFDRIKKFVPNNVISLKQYQDSPEYEQYQKYLEDILTNYRTSTVPKDFDLDLVADEQLSQFQSQLDSYRTKQ